MKKYGWILLLFAWGILLGVCFARGEEPVRISAIQVSGDAEKK